MKTLHIVTGMPASGKTTFAQNLAQTKHATLLDIDVSTEGVVRAALSALQMDPNDRDSPRFKHLFREPIYETLFDIARINLPHCDVVLTGPFTTESNNPDWLDQLAIRVEVPCEIKAYYLSCSQQEIRKRLETRGNPRDANKLKDWSKYIGYFENSGPPEYPHKHIDTNPC